eukprot:m.323144 g.323144  ORF g.323144 m.323144 type:complete len:868 (-) comp19723_c0_seq3:67-2670(-)
MGKRKRVVGGAARKPPSKTEESNPFEMRFTKPKHDVLGRKIKGRIGVRGQARDRANELRKNTLLVEHKQKHKSNEFRDRRIGEYDQNLSTEDKMLMRFAKERQRTHKRSKTMFNLNGDDDGSDDGMQLTHMGQTLGDVEDDYRPDSDDEQDEDEIMGADAVASMHFGGGFVPKRRDQALAEGDEGNDDGQPKTRKEIMMEVVAKSKSHKFARQQEKRENEELLETLDADLDDIHRLLMKTSEAAVVDRPKAESYDVAVRELAYELKASAKDRLKTPEELAAEELEKLQRLEQARQERMRGGGKSKRADTTGYEASAEFLPEHEQEKQKKRGLELRRQGDGSMRLEDSDDSSDDSGDSDGSDHDTEAKPKKKRQADDDGSDESDDSDESDESDADLDESEEEDSSDEDDNDNSEDEQDRDDAKQHSKRRRGDPPGEASPASDLPFVVAMPESLEALMDLLAPHPPQDQQTLLHRIVTCHNVKIKAENRALMEGFFQNLLGLLMQLSADHANFETTNMLAPHLFDVCQQIPQAAAETCKQLLTMLHSEATRRRKMPLTSDLFFFKLIGLLFPTSDFRHAVTTAAYLCVGELLSYARLRSFRDVCAGLFLCTVALDYSLLAERFVPEAVAFLGDLLVCFVSADTAEVQTLRGRLLPSIQSLRDRSPSLLALPKSFKGKTATKMPFAMLNAEAATKPLPEQLIACANATLLLLTKFARLHAKTQAFGELFGPIVQRAATLPKLKVLSARDAFVDFVNETCASKGPIQHLTLQAHRPVPIRQFAPDFQETWSGRKNDADKERKEERKLKYMLKKEQKGAIRELRKDAAFMAKVQLGEMREADSERRQKRKQIDALLGQQAGEMKQYTKGKKK